VLPDGAAQVPRQEHLIVMLLNFADELRRKVPLKKSLRPRRSAAASAVKPILSSGLTAAVPADADRLARVQREAEVLAA
jgi:hypothetical protein